MKTSSFPEGFLLPRLPRDVVAEHSRLLKPLEATLGESIIVLRGRVYTATAASIRAFEASGIDVLFSPEALKEAAAVPDKSPLLGQREKVKGLVFSIGPQGARDVGTVYSIRKGPNGTTVLGLHASDVSSAVRSGGALDFSMRRRGETLDLPEDGVRLPMLPASLAEGKLSLLKGKSRLTKSVEVTFGPEGKILAHRFFRSAVSNQHALDEATASAVMSGRGQGRQTPGLRVALNDLTTLWRKASSSSRPTSGTWGPKPWEEMTRFFSDKVSRLLGEDLAAAGLSTPFHTRPGKNGFPRYGAVPGLQGPAFVRFTEPLQRYSDIEAQRAMDWLIERQARGVKKATLASGTQAARR